MKTVVEVCSFSIEKVFVDVIACCGDHFCQSDQNMCTKLMSCTKWRTTSFCAALNMCRSRQKLARFWSRSKKVKAFSLYNSTSWYTRRNGHRKICQRSTGRHHEKCIVAKHIFNDQESFRKCPRHWSSRIRGELGQTQGTWNMDWGCRATE